MKMIQLTSVSAITTALLTACGGGGSASAPPSATPTEQAITFASPGNQISGASSTLTATASSGLTVSFTSSTPSVCTVTGTTLRLLAPGDCTISANQAGDSTYAAATQVTRTFAVNPLVFSDGYTDFVGSQGGTAQGGVFGLFSGDFQNYDNTYVGGGYTNSTPPVAAADTYFYIAITTSAPSSAGFMGMYVTYANGGLQLSGQTALNIKVGVSPFHFAQSGNKDFTVTIEGLGSGCNPQVKKDVTPTSSDMVSYVIPLSGFVMAQDCGNPALTVAQVLALPVNAVNTQFNSPNLNTTQVDGSVYPTGITRGATSFQ